MRLFPSMKQQIRCKNINLITLKNKKTWETLNFLTVPGWHAAALFHNLKNKINNKYYTCVSLRLLKLNRKPVAWAAIIKRKYSKEIWAYTMPEYRNMGLQKNHLIPYWRKYEPGCSFWTCGHVRQRETFKYYCK